jgi:hypothetical protein
MFVHVLLVLAIYFALQLNTLNFFVLLLGTVLIDLDHLPLWFKNGIRGYLYLRNVKEVGKPRKYFLHNLVTLPTFLICSVLVFYQQYFVFGIFSLGAAAHLGWDFFEDVAIFKMDINHWKT